MIAVKEMRNHGISLNKSLSYSGVSKAKWYYYQKIQNHSTQPNNCWNCTKYRNIKTHVWHQKNGTILFGISSNESRTSRPTYGTRRMAATISKLVKSVNRKQIQRIYRKLGWIEPAKSKNEIIRLKKKLLRLTAPNQLWQTDMTYIWCGMDG